MQFLEKIKLIDRYKVELNISKDEFVEWFSRKVDKSVLGGFDLLLEDTEIYSKSKNTYKGYVNKSVFKVKLRNKLFDSGFNSSIATGKYVQEEGMLFIEIAIGNMQTIYYRILPSIVVFVLFMINVSDLITGFYKYIFILGCFTVLIFAQYFWLSKSVKKLKKALQKDFESM